MGVVYRATDTRLRRDVALKLLSDSVEGAAAGTERLLREARLAATLNHPNICTVHEVGEHDGLPFMALELIDGESLRVVLRRGPLPAERAYRLGHELADAIEHAHAHGVIHGDLKSANIMLTRDGRAKVLDFGIARRASGPLDETRTMTREDEGVAGTPAYMAPELLQGQPPSVRTDIWSLGIVLHEMTSARLPFDGDTRAAITAAILRDPPRPLPPNTPALLARLISR
jgi:serine/threonine protein kinase